MNDDLFELASAYLDGEVTSDERARVEADPELSALVAQLRGISAAISDVAAVDPVRRERSIDAALSAHHVVEPAADVHEQQVVVPLRRPRSARLLSYAAAVLVVGVLGVVVVTGIRSGGSDDSVADAPAEDAPASAELFTTDDTDTGADDAGDTELFATESAPDARDGDDGGGDTLGAPDPSADDADVADDAPADEDGGAVGGSDDAETSAMIDLSTLDDVELAALLREFSQTGSTDASADRGCPNVLDVVIEPADVVAVYAGAPVLLGVADGQGRVVDPTDCSVLAEVAGVDHERSAD